MSARRSSSSPTTSTRRSRPPRARAAGASSPPSPSSPARRSPTRRTRPTFLASKLTRESEPAGLRELYAALLRVRAELPHGDADPIAFDEHAGWLRAGRGPYTILANFSQRDVHVPLDGPAETVLTTHHATLEPGFVVLPALSGALLK